MDRLTTLRSKGIVDKIRKVFTAVGKPVKIMEVCGTHTVSIFKAGIKTILPEGLELVSGPGCPVCVTPRGEIDTLIELAREGYTVATFGDLLKVPGSNSSLYEERAKGCSVKIVTSPLELVKIGGEKLVFASIGFETTAPAVAASILEAKRRGVRFLVLSLHKLIPPAVEAVLRMGSSIDGFLLPGHVSAIIGAKPYEFIAENYGKPGVITGFEPLDILEGIYMVLEMIRSRKPEIKVQYKRVVKAEGNKKALGMIDTVFRKVSSRWRGIGNIEESGLALRDEFSEYDAVKTLGISPKDIPDPEGCLCGEVIAGRKTPVDCVHFGSSCTPEEPLGPCMVSSEGTCSAYYRYGGLDG